MWGSLISPLAGIVGNYMEGKLLVPTPPQRKLRMEEGGMVFKTVKKKPVAKRGYRLKKK